METALSPIQATCVGAKTGGGQRGLRCKMGINSNPDGAPFSTENNKTSNDFANENEWKNESKFQNQNQIWVDFKQKLIKFVCFFINTTRK